MLLFPLASMRGGRGGSKDNGTILLTNNNNNKEKRERTFCFLCIVLQLIQPDQKQLKEE